MIRRIVKRVLDLEDKPGLGVNIVFASDACIRRLNKRYRKNDAFTDCLAFSALEGARIKGADKFLGDIAISVDAAGRQAKLFASTPDKELKLYVIHGVLHLLGYDDETRRGALKMKRRQEELMAENLR